MNHSYYYNLKFCSPPDQDGEEVAVKTSQPEPPMRTTSGWANKVEFSLVPASNTEELEISCSASNSAGQLTETTRLEVTGGLTCFSLAKF